MISSIIKLKKHLLFLPLILLSNVSIAEPVTIIQNGGDSANRVDMVILGDGYSATDIANGTYSADAQRAVDGFFREQPYTDYKNFFNVHRIDVTSVDSGVSHPENNVAKNTALDTYYNCNNIPRLICLSATGITSANDIINRSVKSNQQEIVLVIINDPQYGGAGQGRFALASSGTDLAELTLHETAHSYGDLGDEYVGTNTCVSNVEPAAPNITIETQRAAIKWNQGGGPLTGWIETTTAIPTTVNAGVTGNGLYEGGGYCAKGVYRSSFNSKMRTANLAFNSVSREALIKKLYVQVSPIDSFSPNRTRVAINNTQTFTVSTPVVANGNQNYDITWSVDGVVVQSGVNKSYIYRDNGKAQVNLKVTVKDPTSMVRYDPNSKLKASQTWIVESLTSPPRADLFIDRFVFVDDIVFADASFSEGAGLTYDFDMGDGTYRVTRNPLYRHRYRRPGTYWVRLTVTDSLGRSSQAFANVTVNIW